MACLGSVGGRLCGRCLQSHGQSGPAFFNPPTLAPSLFYPTHTHSVFPNCAKSHHSPHMHREHTYTGPVLLSCTSCAHSCRPRHIPTSARKRHPGITKASVPLFNGRHRGSFTRVHVSGARNRFETHGDSGDDDDTTTISRCRAGFLSCSVPRSVFWFLTYDHTASE